jgi:hypothetical protein
VKIASGRKCLLGCFLAFLFWAQTQPGLAETELGGEISVETRMFPAEPQFPEQFRFFNLSLSVTPEFEWFSEDGDQAFVFKPFYRWDQNDPSRTHADIRELYYEWVKDEWTVQVGINKVFWGVTESNHLVDVINQTDLVENFDGEDKLGQLMAHVTWEPTFGTFEFFLLPGSRPQMYPSLTGRPRFGIRVDPGQRIYGPGAGEGDLDFALRFSNNYGPLDLGVSYFNGTTRQPLFEFGTDFENKPVLIPVYDEISQIGLDAQYTQGGLLLKLEAIHRSGQGDPFFAATGGFEYTFPDVKESGIDVGLVGEYIYDERGEFAPTPFTNEIFLGARFAFNDEQSTDLLAGGIIDAKTGATFLSVEGSRRLADDYKLSVEARAFVGVPEEDFLRGFRYDHHLQLELTRYF